MKKKTWLFLLLLIPLTAIKPGVAETVLPDGWRYPIESDYTGDWASFKGEFPKPFHISGDLNGDKVLDEAWILIRNDYRKWGLFIFLNAPAGKTKIIQVDENPYNASSFPQEKGLHLISPGKQTTACGNGHWKCEKNEPAEIDLRLPAIEYFAFESASQIIYWDKTNFKSVWVSD